MQRWEYLMIEVIGFSGGPNVSPISVATIAGAQIRRFLNYEAALNALGGEGWELVGLLTGTYVFKRPKA
jgi:hypothetical protein